MQELESEIQKPTGISTVSPPKLSISGVLMSKECGILYELENTEGLRYITYVGAIFFLPIADVNTRSRMFFRKLTTCQFISRMMSLYF